jgi:hypothetical protein
MRRHAIPALLLLAAALPAADPAVEAVAPPQVVVVPQSVDLSYSLRFSDQGLPQRTTGTLRMSVWLRPAGGVQLLSCRGVQITEAVTDTGETLRPRRDNGNGQEQFNEYERSQNSYDVSFGLGAPTTPPRAIARVAGTVTLAIVTGAGSQSEVKPLKEFLGKPLLLEGLDSPVTITREDQGLTVRAATGTFERIEKVVGLRADGREIQLSGWSGGSDNDESYRTYRTQIPDDGGLSLRLLPPSTDIVVPFTVGPVTLFQGGSATAAGVIRIPASAPRPAEGAKPKVAEPPRPAPQGAGGF